MTAPLLYGLLICLLSTTTQAFALGCQQFNPLNFNQCLQCTTNYYLLNGNCQPCPTDNSQHTDCQPPAAPSPGPSQQTDAGQTNSTATLSVTEGNHSSSPVETNRPLEGKTAADVTVETKEEVAEVVVQDKMKLLMGMLPLNCVYFTIQSQGIVCEQCGEGFQLTQEGQCSGQSTDSIKSAAGVVADEVVVDGSDGSDGSDVNAGDNKESNEGEIRQSSVVVIGSDIDDEAGKPVGRDGVINSSALEANSGSINIVQLPTAPLAITQTTTATVTAVTSTESTNQTSSAQSQQQMSSVQPQTQTVSVSVAPVVYPDSTAEADINCRQLNGLHSLTLAVGASNRRCVTCYQYFYYNITLERCLPQNPLCKECDDSNSCLSCYPGYILLTNSCFISNGQVPLIVSSSSSSSSSYNPTATASSSSSSSSSSSYNPTATASSSSVLDPNCVQHDPLQLNLCLQCASRYYPSSTHGLCSQVDPSCRTFNSATGICLSCYTGYSLNITNLHHCYKLKQAITTLSSVTDPTQYQAYCLFFQGQTCVKCLQRYFLFNGLCFPVSDLCKTYSSSFGFCQSCYPGYQLIEGKCSVQQSAASSDPYCLVLGGQGCSQCSTSYFPKEGVCCLVSGLCNGYDRSTGHCTACLQPYQLDLPTGECRYLS